MAVAPSNVNLKIKLLIDKENQRVLFAEAKKEFVDVIFSLMSLPLGTVVKLLSKKQMEGCITDIYNGIQSLENIYVQSSKNIKSILNPKTPHYPLLLPNEEYLDDKKVYMCLYHEKTTYIGPINNVVYHRHASRVPKTSCPSCNKTMSCQLEFVDLESDSKDRNRSAGFVKKAVTYMVMDNLEVRPLSTMSSIALFHSFGLHDLASIEEKIVDN